MTVPSTTRRAGPYLGNDVATSFPFTFKVFSTSDIALTLTDTLGTSTTLVLDTDYSVALNVDQDSSPGGSITYPLSGSPLATGETLVGLGALPYDQTTDLPSGGPYRATTVEDTFDRTVFQIQQLAEAQGRALALSPASAAGVSVTLPAPGANKVLGWNLAENALVNYDNNGGGGTTLPSIAGQAGKFLTNNGAVLSWGSPSSGGTYKNLKVDFNCVGDGVTDDTVNFLAAIAATQGVHALFIPAGTYLVSQTLEWTAMPVVFGEGATLSIIKSSVAGEMVRFKTSAGAFWRYPYLGKLSIHPTVAGGGTNPLVWRLANDHTVSGNPAVPDTFSFCANWHMEDITLGDAGGFGLVFDNPGNLNGFFGGRMDGGLIYNGMALNSFGDTNLFNTVVLTDGPSVLAAHGGGRPSISGSGLPGARQTTFFNCSTTCSGGAYVFSNCEQWRIIGAQAEMIVDNKVPYGAGTVPSNNGWITLNNCSGTVIENSTLSAGGGTSFTATGTTTNTSTSITGLSSTAGIYPGCTIKGTGIPVGSRVLTVVGTTITITPNPATASGTVTLTFGYSADATIVMTLGTINTVIQNTALASGATWHYVISAGSYDNKTQGLNTYTGIAMTAQVSDFNTGSAYNSIEDPLSKYSRDPIFFNPFTDLINGNPANTFPSGFSPTGAATCAQETSLVYDGNRVQVAAKITSVGTNIANGVDIVPSNQPWKKTEFISGCVALRANNTTNGRGLLFFVDGATITQVGITTIAGAYQLLPFRCRINAGNNWSLRIAVGDGAGNYSAGFNLYIGGVSLVEGPYWPEVLQDSVARRLFQFTQAALPYNPPFSGARLYDSGAGKLHIAFDSTSPAGWGTGFTP